MFNENITFFRKKLATNFADLTTRIGHEKAQRGLWPQPKNETTNPDPDSSGGRINTKIGTTDSHPSSLRFAEAGGFFNHEGTKKMATEHTEATEILDTDLRGLTLIFVLVWPKGKNEELFEKRAVPH